MYWGNRSMSRGNRSMYWDIRSMSRGNGSLYRDIRPMYRGNGSLYRDNRSMYRSKRSFRAPRTRAPRPPGPDSSCAAHRSVIDNSIRSTRLFASVTFAASNHRSAPFSAFDLPSSPRPERRGFEGLAKRATRGMSPWIGHAEGVGSVLAMAALVAPRNTPKPNDTKCLKAARMASILHKLGACASERRAFLVPGFPWGFAHRSPCSRVYSQAPGRGLGSAPEVDGAVVIVAVAARILAPKP